MSSLVPKAMTPRGFWDYGAPLYGAKSLSLSLTVLQDQVLSRRRREGEAISFVMPSTALQNSQKSIKEREGEFYPILQRKLECSQDSLWERNDSFELCIQG